MENQDKFKLGAAVAVLALGITAFYLLPTQSQIIKVAAVVLSVVLAAAVLWFSATGRSVVDYARDSIKEAEKVVWPSKKEVWQITGLVFVFALVLSLFMWGVDKGLEWFFYDLLLGRK